jgi:hypothetical protein
VRVLAAITTLSLVVMFVLAATPRAARAANSPFAAGDQLVYAITVELQQHHVRGSGSKSLDNATASSAQGTATFTIYSIGSDGTAYANVALDFKGLNEGEPVTLDSVTTGKILPDGQLRTKTQVGLGVSDAIGAADTTAGEITGQAPLAVGKSWTNAAKTPFILMTMTRKVVGKTKYGGFQAYALQSLGSGTLLKTADGQPASGTVTVSGTTYYDNHDRVLIGEALRSLTVVQMPGGASMHDDYSAAFNVVLNAWTHASPAPGGEAAAGTQASPQPGSTTYAPAPAASSTAPLPIPTVTPRSGS